MSLSQNQLYTQNW